MPHICTDPRQALWSGQTQGDRKADAAWTGHDVGVIITDEESRELVTQGNNVKKLMQHHASYNAFPATGWYEGNDPEDEDTTAPDQPAAYSDGSVRPSKPIWASSAAIGVYWPNKQAAKNKVAWSRRNDE